MGASARGSHASARHGSVSALDTAGCDAVGAASTLPLSAGVTAADPRREGPKPDMDEVDPERFDDDEAIREYEQIETRTGAEI